MKTPVAGFDFHFHADLFPDPRRNHPEDPVALSERLAAARSISVEELRSVVAANATRVFAFAGIQATFEPITPTRGEPSV
jgi:Tat protein secretion system quality control protein TatD with DNase activity